MGLQCRRLGKHILSLLSYPEHSNYSQKEPNDLSFHAGDIIDIISETNADWWTGKINGRQGLFPSNYVEKLASRAPSPINARPIPVPAPPQRSEPSYSRAPSYSTPPPPFPNHNAYSSPPPPQHWQPPQGPPPQPYGGYHQPPPIMNEKQQQQVVYAQPPPPQVQIQAPPPQEPKKSKFGGLGNTVSTPFLCAQWQPLIDCFTSNSLLLQPLAVSGLEQVRSL